MEPAGRHKKIVIPHEMTVRGKKLKRYHVEYERDAAQVESMRIHHMGAYAKYPRSKDPKAQELVRRRFLMARAPDIVASSLIAMRLQDDTRPYMVVGGADIMQHYLSRGEGDIENRWVYSGYAHLPLLFIRWGYGEASNKYLPQLIQQIFCQRFQRDQQVWLFFPCAVAHMSQQWKTSLPQELQKIVKLYEVPALSDIQEAEKTSAVSIGEVRDTNPEPAVKDSGLIARQDPEVDRKFSSNKKNTYNKYQK